MKLRSQLAGALLAFGLCLVCVSDSRADGQALLKGHVYDQVSCAPLVHFIIKLIPSIKSSSRAELITNTDEHGDFQVAAPEFGEYYLAVFEGVNQVYGHVTNFRDGNVAMIALKPIASKERGPGQGCITPVAIALSPEGRLFVLDSHNGILEYSTVNQTDVPDAIARFTSSWEATDMAIAESDSQEHLFVTLVQGSIGQLMQYSAHAQFEGSWLQFSPLSGVCADNTAGRVYVATWGTDQLLQQMFFAPQDSHLQLPARFSGVRDWGPLALDSDGRILYAAEQIKGLLYAFDLKSMKVKQVAEGLGQPTAMVFDQARKRLLVADTDGRQIWAISIGPTLGRPAVLIKSQLFQSPSAIAASSDGKVWVGDQSAHAVFEFGSDHRLVRTIK